jgi:hypothetical protein
VHRASRQPRVTTRNRAPSTCHADAALNSDAHNSDAHNSDAHAPTAGQKGDKASRTSARCFSSLIHLAPKSGTCLRGHCRHLSRRIGKGSLRAEYSLWERGHTSRYSNSHLRSQARRWRARDPVMNRIARRVIVQNLSDFVRLLPRATTTVLQSFVQHAAWRGVARWPA